MGLGITPFQIPPRPSPQFRLLHQRREPAIGGQLIDKPWQNLRQLSGEFFLREAGSLGKRLYDVRAKGRTKLIRQDRLILARTNPGIDHIAQPAFLKFVHQPAQSFQQAAVSLIGCRLGPLSGRTFFAASSKQSARRKEGEKSEYQRFSDAAWNSRTDYIFGACHCLPPTGYVGNSVCEITPGGPLAHCRPKAPRPSPQLRR